MDPKKYREQFTAEMAAAETVSRGAGNAAADRRGVAATLARVGGAAGADDSVAARVDAIGDSAPDAVADPEVMRELVRLLADPAENDQVRLAALTALQQNTFRSAEFQPYQNDFVRALHAAATDDDQTLRERALDLLALNGDPYAQELLINGLRNPEAALVPPQVALRMIGYDVHAEHYDLLRSIVETSKKPKLRQAALKLLAADSGSKDLFARIAADPAESTATRSTSALALQALAPEEFSAMAPSLMADDSASTSVKATVLTAMSHGPGENPSEVTRIARDLSASDTAPAAMKSAARQFLKVTEDDGDR